jgi:hypothetical protein
MWANPGPLWNIVTLQHHTIPPNTLLLDCLTQLHITQLLLLLLLLLLA